VSDIVYDFNGIDNLSASIMSFVSQMNSHLDEVDSTFKTLLANGWGGTAAQAFEPCSRRWHQHAGELASTLHELSKRVGNAAANMAAADASAAARF
jgi:WXG100 family type VII secretion target